MMPLELNHPTGIGAPVLSADELAALGDHEATIASGLAQFVAVGDALLAIRDARLYRAAFSTFEAYCQERWGFSSRRARGLISAAEVVSNLSESGSNGSTLPENERQARELSSFTPIQQQIIWDVVQQTAPEGKVSNAHIKSIGVVLREIIHTDAVDNGDGVAIPLAQATPDHLKAAVTEETYERLKRQESYIAARTQSLETGTQIKPQILAALLPFLPDIFHSLWLPLAADQPLVEPLRVAGYNSILITNSTSADDIRKSEAGYRDVLIAVLPPGNPNAWLEACYGTHQRFAMLLPVATLGYTGAQALFRERGVEAVFLDEPIATSGGSKRACAWFTWGLEIGTAMTFATKSSGLIE